MGKDRGRRVKTGGLRQTGGVGMRVAAGWTARVGMIVSAVREAWKLSDRMLPGLTGFLVDERTGVRTGRCGVLVGAYRARASGRVIRRSQMVPARLGRHRVRLKAWGCPPIRHRGGHGRAFGAGRDPRADPDLPGRRGSRRVA